MSRPFRLIIAGSRDLWVRVDLIEAEVQEFLAKLRQKQPIEVVSGKAKGVDSCGEAYAKTHSLVVHPYPADWDRYGKAAGHIRNRQMAEFADAALIFIRAGKPTPGSANMLMWAHIYGRHHEVVEV